MAEVKGVSISATTVQSLKSEIKSLKDEISALILVDGDYQKKATELTAKQLELSKATEVTKGAVIGVEKSYAQLVAQTNALRKEWRSVDMGSERFKELSEQINANNNRLKEMDKSIGDNFRNVGNYTEGFSQALSTLGSKFPSVQQGIMGVQKGFTLLSANPVLGTFTLIVTIIQKVVAVMKQSEEGTKALSKIMGVFDGVLTMVTKGFEFLGKGIAWVAEKITDLTKKWFKGNKVIEDNVTIQQKQIELEELHRKNIVESAKIENEISDLRAKASDKIKYSAKERVDFLEKAVAKELQLSRKAQDEAQKEYELIVLKNAQTKSGTKDLEAEARAQAKVIQMQTEYNKKMREYNAQLTEARNALKKTARAQAGAQAGATSVSFLGDIDQTEKELEQLVRTTTQMQIEGLKEQTAERLRYAELDVQSESEKAKAIFDIQQQALLDEYALLVQGLDNKLLVDDEKIKAEKRLAQITRDLAFNTAQEEQRLSAETAEKKKKNQENAIRVSLAGANAMSSILGSVADMYEEQGEANAKSAQRAKNLRISGATIDMLSGITAAMSGLFTTKSGPWDIALAAIQAATIAATGIANISKIKNTDVSGNSAGGGASSAIVSAPAVVQQVPLTRTLTGVAEAEDLNKSQRVYVVYDDIAEAGRKTEVTEQESTF